MDSTGAQVRKYSSRESQFVSESFEFLGSEEVPVKETDTGHVSNQGSGDIRDEHSEELSSCSQEKQRGRNVKDILRRRASSHPSGEKNSESEASKKHSRESVFINDAFGFLQEEITEESSVPNEVKSMHTPTSGQRPPLRKYSSRESQFVSETFDFLTLDEDEEEHGNSLAVENSKSDNPLPRKYSSRESQFVSETFDFLPLDEEEEDGTSPAVENSKCDKRLPRKYSSRESQFVSETFEFLSSGDDEDCPSGKPVMRKDNQPPLARKHSFRESQSVTILSSDKKEGVSDADSVPVGGATKDNDNVAEPSAGCATSGDDRTSILRSRSRKGRSRCVESINSTDDDIANRTESAIVKLALKRVGEFSEDKFLVEYESEGSEETEEEHCEEYDSGLQESYTAEDTCSEVSDDTSMVDDGSVRTSSDVSDGGTSSTPATADMNTVRKTKKTDSTSTTASETDFLEKGMQGSLRKRLIHRQSSVVTYQCVDGNSEVDKVVDVVKEEGESDYGFHLSGSAPVVISTVEPGSCAARSGLSVGDALITIDTKNIAAASVDEVIEIIKQSPEKVTLGVRQESLPFDRTLCCGYMMKQGGKGMFKNWKKRWLDLKADHCLYYYKSEQDKEPVGAIVLPGYTVVRAPEVNKQHTFKLFKCGHRSYYFQADTAKDMNRWAGVLANMATTTAKTNTWLDVSTHNVGLAALSIKDPECHGFLTKLGGRVKTWKRRYCVVKDACLYYFIDVNSHTAQGIVHLHGYYVLETSQQGKKFGFTLLAPEANMRIYHFFTENQTDYTRWINALKSSIGKWVKKEDVG